jgi:hypothetical protein
MRAIPVALAVVLAAFVAAAPPKETKPKIKPGARNLVANGDFEAGTDTPAGWQKVDGLTTFWVNDPDGKRGKVLKFDTDVLQEQGYDWWVKIADGARAKDAPKKKPTTPPKYDTLAGLDGVWYWSDFFPLEKGKAYWLTLDVKGPEIMAWLVGYPEKGSTAFGADAKAFQEYFREKKAGKPRDNVRGFDSILSRYDYRGQLKAGGPNEWRTYSRRAKPFRPTEHTPNVRFGRILLLPYWPPGEYYVDNVRLVEVEDPEARGGDRSDP